jgi:hypothetical protein
MSEFMGLINQKWPSATAQQAGIQTGLLLFGLIRASKGEPPESFVLTIQVHKG